MVDIPTSYFYFITEFFPTSNVLSNSLRGGTLFTPYSNSFSELERTHYSCIGDVTGMQLSDYTYADDFPQKV